MVLKPPGRLPVKPQSMMSTTPVGARVNSPHSVMAWSVDSDSVDRPLPMDSIPPLRKIQYGA